MQISPPVTNIKTAPDRQLPRHVPFIAIAILIMSLNTVPAANAPDKPVPTVAGNAIATLGGGCFWCLEAVFERVEGIKSVTSGYAGGKVANPTYKQVCNGDTGHAEVIQIEYDPAKISFDQVLDLFWEAHDPTTLNRQGADTGTQYRSIILYHDDGQKAAAEKSRKAASARLNAPVVTEIVPLKEFFPAEAYHQDYFRNNPNAPYCVAVINPKLKKIDKATKK